MYLRRPLRDLSKVASHMSDSYVLAEQGDLTFPAVGELVGFASL